MKESAHNDCEHHEQSRNGRAAPRYVGPDLRPDELVLEPEQIATGVYALMANVPPKDNSGLVVGERAALVIDAGINGAVAHQIQGIARQLARVPVRFLVNTSYHGDHTFGNYAFPNDVTIISSRHNWTSMGNLEREKRMRAGNLRGNLSAIADVTAWRRPDIVFEHYLQIDLGARVVELWWFGPGNGPGDTIVYLPGARVAWTGNYLPAAGIPPMLLEGGPDAYQASLKAMKGTLDLGTIVPGHGPMGDGKTALESLIGYLQSIRDQVREAMAAGGDLDSILSDHSVPERLSPPPGIPPTPELKSLLPNLHRLNLLATYRALSHGAEPGAGPH